MMFVLVDELNEEISELKNIISSNAKFLRKLRTTLGTEHPATPIIDRHLLKISIKMEKK